MLPSEYVGWMSEIPLDAAREALAEIEAGAKPITAEQVWAEMGLDA